MKGCYAHVWKKHRDNGEKIYRYSIRKYHFGAASVAVAALMFFANGAVVASETITPTTASDVVKADSDSNADGNPESSDEGDSKKALTDQPAELKSADEPKGQEAPVSTDGMTPESVERYNAAKQAAEQAVNEAKEAAQNVLNKGDNATAEEVAAAKTKVEAAQTKLDEAKKLLVPQSDNTGLTAAKNALDTERNKAVDTTGKTPESVSAYNDAKQKAKDASDAAQTVLNNQNATEQEIQAEITKVNKAKEKLAEAEAGLVDKPTSVPSKDGNSGNTNNSTNTNSGGTTTPATPSSTVGQAQASSPAQETPSSETRPVDKSELDRLVEELETRLKDLDGIDQSVIDAAKVILGEGQEALRNADLTEAGLKEMTAKVKEALESLKGKQATKDEEEMKETRKEQGHLPYGTMIGSLLALLGLLLFLIARRKKESELKKLAKELTKVLQDGDLTSVDAKVLDQAREALAQAVAFLANEKESDHTEDELIEKLKAILAQLR